MKYYVKSENEYLTDNNAFLIQIKNKIHTYTKYR